jgi:hypothetical protein
VTVASGADSPVYIFIPTRKDRDTEIGIELIKDEIMSA